MRIAEDAHTDVDTIRGMLAEAGLPFDDIGQLGRVRFLTARDDQGVIVGVAGLEICGKSGLLRSLVVDAHARRHGLGAQLTLNVERLAGSLGVENLYLLTNTAERFFSAHGYERFERARVPEEIAGTTEFKLLCPSAACMRKHLQNKG
jgi:amino-acid N-acetyltransferase